MAQRKTTESRRGTTAHAHGARMSGHRNLLLCLQVSGWTYTSTLATENPMFSLHLIGPQQIITPSISCDILIVDYQKYLYGHIVSCILGNQVPSVPIETLGGLLIRPTDGGSLSSYRPRLKFDHS